MPLTLERPIETPVTGFAEGKINRSTVKDLFAAGILNKTAYIALCLRLDQPTNGEIQEIDPVEYADELTFEGETAKGKAKKHEITPSDVEMAIATLQKKQCLQCDRPPVQLTIGLMY